MPKQSQTNNQTSFAGNFLRLVSGNGLASLITFLAMPILSRLFPPEAFGLAALFASLTGILGVLACMRYEMSIVLPKDDKEAANLFGVSLAFACITSLLMVPAVYFAKPIVSDHFNLPDLAHYLWLVPIAMFINGVFTSFNYWNTRTKHFTRLSIAQVTNQIVANGGMLGAGFSGITNGGAMIVAAMIGKAFSALTLAGQIIRDHGKFFYENIRPKAMIDGLKRHKKFPLYGSWSILLGVGSWQLPVLMLGVFFSPVIVGFYALGFRILQAPMNLIGSAIGQVFFQSAAEAHSEGKLAPLVEKLFEQLVKVGLFPLLVLTFIGQDLYVFVFGENWAEAGLYTQILSIWAFFWFLSGPFTTVFAILERQGLQLKWNVFNFSLRFGAILIGGLYEDALLAIWLLAISGTALYISKIFITLFIAGASLKTAIKTLLRYSLLFVPAGMILSILYYLNISTLWILLVSGLLFAVHGCYIAYNYLPLIKDRIKVFQ